MRINQTLAPLGVASPVSVEERTATCGAFFGNAFMNIEVINQAVKELQALRERIKGCLPKHDQYLRVELELNGCNGDGELSIWHTPDIKWSGPPSDKAEEQFVALVPGVPAYTEKRIAALEAELAVERERLAASKAEAV